MAKKCLYPIRLLPAVLLILCFGFFSISGSASQIDLVDREDFVVDIQLTVYNVRHQYYTDGNLDGTVYDGYASDDGYSGMDAIVSGTTKLTSYNGNSYRYAYYSVDSANSILTLVYTRESSPPEPVATDPPATEPPVTEPEPEKPVVTEPPATQPEKPAPTQPPVEEVTLPEIPVEEVTQLEAEPVAEDTAPPAQQEVLTEDPVPLAQTPTPEPAAPEQAVKAEQPPVEVPRQAEAPTENKGVEPWLFAARIGAIAVITLGAALMLFSFTRKQKK